MGAAFDISSLKGLSQDSRTVRSGYLFAALPGATTDGRSYIESAIANGASVILAPPGTKHPAQAHVKLLTDDNPRRRFAQLASEFYARRPGYLAAVTGTNGKTSTALFTAQLWHAVGKKSASIGTLGVVSENCSRPGAMTTPDPVTLHQELEALAGEGVTHVCLEASSHGLDQYRLDGLAFDAAGFTNVTHDHLDYHGTLEEYFTSKMRLFTDLLKAGGTAILNADVPEFSALKDACVDRQVKVISYGRNAEHLQILEWTPLQSGQSLKLKIFGETHALVLPLVGGFQVMNALCALGLVLADNRDALAECLCALSQIKGAPGRLQYVPGHPHASVYVDYAHTPDALENILQALRAHTHGRLVCLFGCGGDRDAAKRPLMGGIAARLADQVIVTDDNPRSEDPRRIRAEILRAAPQALEIPDRREAIHSAVKNLSGGDVLVIAGKGHEQGQIFKDRTDPFDDVIVAAQAIQSLR